MKCINYMEMLFKVKNLFFTWLYKIKALTLYQRNHNIKYYGREI